MADIPLRFVVILFTRAYAVWADHNFIPKILSVVFGVCHIVQLE